MSKTKCFLDRNVIGFHEEKKNQKHYYLIFFVQTKATMFSLLTIPSNKQQQHYHNTK